MFLTLQKRKSFPSLGSRHSHNTQSYSHLPSLSSSSSASTPPSHNSAFSIFPSTSSSFLFFLTSAILQQPKTHLPSSFSPAFVFSPPSLHHSLTKSQHITTVSHHLRHLFCLLLLLIFNPTQNNHTTSLSSSFFPSNNKQHQQQTSNPIIFFITCEQHHKHHHREHTNAPNFSLHLSVTTIIHHHLPFFLFFQPQHHHPSSTANRRNPLSTYSTLSFSQPIHKIHHHLQSVFFPSSVHHPQIKAQRLIVDLNIQRRTDLKYLKEKRIGQEREIEPGIQCEKEKKSGAEQKKTIDFGMPNMGFG